MLNSRAHPRAPIELKVAYQRMNAFFADYTRDISKGGIYIKTDSPLPVGTEFTFQVTLPRRPQSITLEGRVMWINDGSRRPSSPAPDLRAAGDGAPDGVPPGANAKPEIAQHGMGIQFIWRDDAARESFEKLVEDLMIDTLGEPLYRKLLEKART